MKKAILIFTAAILLGVSPARANAQTLDVGIYPPVFQIQATPPSDVKIPFFVQNFTNTTIPFDISLKAFTANNQENGSVQFTDTPDFADPFLPERIQVLDEDNPIGNLTLAPQQKKDLTLEVQIPSNEAKGDYYLSLIFTSPVQPLESGTVSQETLSISSNILLSVGPLGNPQGYIENFSAPFFVSQGPVPFTVRVKNTSDHYVTTQGNIVIKNMFGQTIGQVNLLPVNILANTVRRIPDDNQTNLNSQNYQQIKNLINTNLPVAIWPEKFLIGPYTASLTLALSDSGPILKREITFFAFPLEYLLAIAVIIALVIYIAARVNRSRRKI
jgi:hypothetical protein